MKKKDIAILVFTIGLFVVLGTLFFAPTQQQAPDITLLTLDGKKLSLTDLRGKPVLIDFWATTCVTCVKELPEMIRFYNDYKDRGVRVIGVAMSYDPPNQVLNLHDRIKIPYTIALDLKAEAAQAFGDVRLTPTHFLIDPSGKIVLRKVGLLDFPALRKQIDHMLTDNNVASLQ